MNKPLLALVLALTLSACGQQTTPPPDAAPLGSARSADRQGNDVEAAISGLLYLSESEYPWTYNPVPEPNRSDWLESWEGATLEQRRTFRAFFRQLKDPALTGDDAERYRVLERVLRRNFNHLTVYWVIDPADPVAVRVVILGQNRLGVFALGTVSIET